MTPTSLHSIMFLLFLKRRSSFVRVTLIYIPLCFYYFFTEPTTSTNPILFTFHYVSIISAACRRSSGHHRNLHSIMFLLFHTDGSLIVNLIEFTFHYVSIISKEKTGKTFKELNLHSIMFLLFPAAALAACFRSQIYIPLCFYYFAAAIKAGMKALIFTFHYVSIISTADQAAEAVDRNLHSIMFLLFLLSEGYHVATYIFTFHYVSIIS